MSSINHYKNFKYYENDYDVSKIRHASKLRLGRPSGEVKAPLVRAQMTYIHHKLAIVYLVLDCIEMKHKVGESGIEVHAT